MFIKSVIVEGFKSYAHRTEINDFDPLFNAITGLNGSGKSNILDAICFLLGITNLTQVRAGNLQDLVYKCGQAGIAKATVCITFDNQDKKQSPLGYEQYDDITITRQVVIGGRNKYLINGSNANNSRVQDLFHSVQLNVNNPHFLIMQGRITKVLNMKPPEILSLIEEAAGTRLYESKKEVAKKTIEKKDLKLRAIEAVLNEDITPSLKKLKDERSSYLEYQKVLRELEHLNKLYIAHRYFSAEGKKKQSEEELDDIVKQKNFLTKKTSELESRKGELEVKIVELEKRRDEVSGKVLEECENNLTEKQKELALCQSKHENKIESLKAEMKRKKQIESNLLENEKSLTVRSSDLLDLNGALALLKTNQKQDQEKYEEAQNHLHAVTVGLSSNDDGADASLTDQLISAKKDITASKTEQLSSQNKLRYFQKELKEQQFLVKEGEDGYQNDQKLYNSICQEVFKVETEMKKLCYDEAKDEKLVADQKRILINIEDLRGKLDLMSSRYPRLSFEYTDPEKNFDHSRVKGLVCKLVQVQNKRTATSLEVAAGGKLYNVVVDTEVTAKKLVDNGQLKKRYTIIPLNKISSRPIDREIVKIAESLVGKENVNTALSLVGYHKELHTAMQYVFGSCFICPDLEISKQVTYNEKIMKMTVTLDGDCFDPSGTLTGGARKQKTGILQILQEFKQLEVELKLEESKVEKINREIEKVKSAGERYLTLKMEYDLKMQEANKIKAKLEQTLHHEKLTVISNLSASIEKQKNILKNAEEKQKKFEEKVKDLENKLKNAKTVRENELKLAEKSLNQAKARKEKSEKELKYKLQEIESINLEQGELKKEIDGYKKQLETTVAVINEAESVISEMNLKHEEMKVAVCKLHLDVSEQKKMLKLKNKEILENVNQLNFTQKEINATQIEIQDMEHKISKHQKDSREAHRLVENLFQEHEWIAEERKFFGKPNTSYDFKVHDPKEAERRISKLTETRDELSKNVNMRAMNMLGKAEEQYNDLIKKRQIVLNDKAKIASVIVELDEKKNDALKKAWTQVNKDFNSIFSSLLPGTQAKLTPLDGKTVLDGLEIKVAFGDVWKESLSELSGGQRSLVALSLILSLLLFKPAPIYILDEVDAALDLSHTQNIGQMIRSHFQHSQFIVVSLKDGMFTNANVLFKTKFVDGVSTVTRHAQHLSRPAENAKSKQQKKILAK